MSIDEAENEVKKYSVLCIRERESKDRLKAEIADLDKKIVELKETVERDAKNQEFVKNIVSTYTAFIFNFFELRVAVSSSLVQNRLASTLLFQN